MSRLSFAVALSAAAVAGPAAASVRAIAIREPINPNNEIISTNTVNTGGFAFADIVSTIGFAQAGASIGSGRVAAQSQVSLQTVDPAASGVFSARAQGTQTDTFRLGDALCNEIDCLPAISLGIDSFEFDFRVRAFGTVAAAVGEPRFDRAQSQIDYLWILQNGALATGGGGSRLRDTLGTNRGSITSQTGTMKARPGDSLQLSLDAQLFSTAALSSGQTSGFASTNANFGHTLEWDGVFALRAFGANGTQVQLAPDRRLVMLDDAGNDFWFSAARFNPVPEPSSWALMIAGFGLAGAAARRRQSALVAS